MDATYGAPEHLLAHYTCFRAPGPIEIDGRLDKPVWSSTPRSSRFVDLVTGEPAIFDTRMACLWDEEALYVAYWVEEPFVRATLTERDSFIWLDNDVELFIAGEDCYYELEINAFGTIYEVFFIYQDALRRGSRFERAGFDPLERSADVLGGFQDGSRHGRHPRGKRWAFLDFDLPGLRTAVQVDGTINDDSQVDRGWTVEMALPWAGLAQLFAQRRLPPREGDVLRADFSRFEALRLQGRPVVPSAGWALNPHGVWDSHIPESFSYLHFTERTADRA